ncbi:MAG: sugar phosphate isomerase/epimerase [Alistipes sp.]|nr:sugar phosphate isomerase/epimerase [Alistipes sp.]
MRRFFIAIAALALLSCGGEEWSSGPDWSKLPSKPEQEEGKDEQDKEQTENQVTIITPTTENADPKADISNLQYIPGMQINVADDTFATRLEEVAAAGFKYVELKIKYAYGLHNRTDEQVNATFAAMQKQMEQKGIIVWSIHLPYEDKNWTSISASESIRTQSVEYILRSLRLCAENFPTCKNYVLHASKSASENDTAVKQAHKSLMQMDEVAKKYGVRFCVENLVGSFCFTVERQMEVIKPFDNVYATFDIGHANCKGYDVVEFLKSLGTKLGTVHIHDTVYNSGSDSHKLVGDGDIATKNRSWGEIYKTLLQDNGYRGVFMFEPKDDQSAAEVMRRYNEIVLESYKSL